MPLITVPELASYLRDTFVSGAGADLIVELADGLVSEAVGVVPVPVPTRIRAIAFEVAARAWRNPDGYLSESIDDYTFRTAGQVGVHLTSGERAELIALVARPASGGYSVPLLLRDP